MLTRKLLPIALYVVAALFTGCNPSISKVAENTNKVNKNEPRLEVNLRTFFNPQSLYIEIDKKKQIDYSAATKSAIIDYASSLFDREINANVNKSGSSGDFQGFVKCTMTSRKEKTRFWGIVVPCVIPCCGMAPAGHQNFERNYRFELFDAMGRKIKTYDIKGSKNNVMMLLSPFNYDGTELAAFKNALKEFEKHLASDATYLNQRLTKSAVLYNRETTKGITDRDEILAEWLNSGDLPSDYELDQAISEAPNDYVGWGLRAVKNYSQGLYLKALEDVEKYCELNPACRILKPFNMKANVLYRIGRFDEALEALVLSEAFHPKYEDNYILKGELLTHYGAISDAIEAYEKAASLTSDDSEIKTILSTLRNIKSDYAAQRENEQLEELNRRMTAMSGISNAMNNAANSLNRGNNKNNVVSQNNNQPNNSQIKKNIVKKRKCSLCDGTGSVIKTDGVNFGGDHYCNECHKIVTDSHYHNLCPVCKGDREVSTL